MTCNKVHNILVFVVNVVFYTALCILCRW